MRARMAAAIVAAAWLGGATPDAQQELIRLGIVPEASPAPVAALKPFIAAEIVRLGDIVKKAGLAGSQ